MFYQSLQKPNNRDMQSELNRIFQSQFRAILKQIREFRHKQALLQHSNKMIEVQLEAIRQQNLKRDQYLNEISFLLSQLNVKTDISFPEDHDESKMIHKKEQMSRYSSKIANENKIMGSNVVYLPNESLQKLALHFQNFTIQKVTEAIRSSIEMRRTLEKIEQTKDKFIKQRQAQQKLQQKNEQETRSERGSQLKKTSQNSE